MKQSISDRLEKVNLLESSVYGSIYLKNAILSSTKQRTKCTICVNLFFGKRLQINNYYISTIWSFFPESNTVLNLPICLNMTVVILLFRFANFSNKNSVWLLV